jgi:hypothetical protein
VNIKELYHKSWIANLVGQRLSALSELIDLVAHVYAVDQDELILCDKPKVYSFKDLCGSLDLFNTLDFFGGVGIFITSIKPPESGWVVALHCSVCKMTEFSLSQYAREPEDGGYWLVQECRFYHPSKVKFKT